MADGERIRERYELGVFTLIVQEATDEELDEYAVPWEVLLSRNSAVLPLGSGLTRENAVEYATATLSAALFALRGGSGGK